MRDILSLLINPSLLSNNNNIINIQHQYIAKNILNNMSNNLINTGESYFSNSNFGGLGAYSDSKGSL